MKDLLPKLRRSDAHPRTQLLSRLLKRKPTPGQKATQEEPGTQVLVLATRRPLSIAKLN